MAKKQTDYTETFRKAVESHKELLEARDAAQARIDRIKARAADYRRQAEEMRATGPTDANDPLEGARQGREFRQTLEDLEYAAERVESELAAAEKELEATNKELFRAVNSEIGRLCQEKTEAVKPVIQSLLDDLEKWVSELQQVQQEYSIKGPFPHRPKIMVETKDNKRLEHFLHHRML